MRNYLAIDIGASGGRHISGFLKDGEMCIEEIYRFDNFPLNKNERLFWDVDLLINHIIAGLKKCKELNRIPESVGIDTWGVDYALLDKNDKLAGGVYCYRDSRTEASAPKVHGIIPQAELYERTGISFQYINTVYQLADDLNAGRLEEAETFLMLPDYFNFLLTGVKANEYTNATTTGMVSVRTKEWDKDIIQKLAFPSRLFKKLASPGINIGTFTDEIQKRTGFNANVVLPCTHDTASAVFAVPHLVSCESGRREDSIYISSGTWSLMGIELDEAKTDEESRAAGFSNEGGYGYKYRYLKNIMGLWIIQRVSHELNNKYSFDEIDKLAKQAQSFSSQINVNDKRFFSPASMVKAVDSYLTETGQKIPETDGERFYCVYHSLAVSYAQTAGEIERLTGKKYGTIHIVGGGSRNLFLSELTAEASGKKIIRGPAEATAIGNLAIQMIAAGEIKDKTEARQIIRNSFNIETAQEK